MDMQSNDASTQKREEVYPAQKQDVELYIRTYNTMLRSSSDIKIKALVQAHINSDSSLHTKAAALEPDFSAFTYSLQRLPDAITKITRVLLGQSEDVFKVAGYDVEKWQSVSAPGRRRRWFYDGRNTLAVYIASSSDLDDVIPVLVGLQIEWNKLNVLLNKDPNTLEILRAGLDEYSPLYGEMVKVLTGRLMISVDDWERLRAIWGGNFWNNLLTIAARQKSFSVRMLGGSYTGYGKAAHRWWRPIDHKMEELQLQERPVYFISSNTHSIINLVSGSAQRLRGELDKHMRNSRDPLLIEEYENIMAGESRSSLENFLYYIMRAYLGKNRKMLAQRESDERERGIHFVPTSEGMAVDAQIIELNKLRAEEFDPRLGIENFEAIRNSDAVILNIDYPLGLAAYFIMVQVAQSLENIKGIYVLGKAATLNGSIGDVMISDSIYDEHSQNTYWLDNCFTAADVAPYLVYGSVLDNQKAVTVKGTYLQNRHYLDEFYRESYTVVEMEAGPYMDGLYEHIYSSRYPTGEHVNFKRLNFDLGIVHYASDTPYTRGKNLGASSLAYLGMDSTYATSIAILRRVLAIEGAYRKPAEYEPQRVEMPSEEQGAVAVAQLAAEAVESLSAEERVKRNGHNGRHDERLATIASGETMSDG